MSDLDLEKGFNESELEDIMSEIESLEKDLGEVEELASAEPIAEESVEEPVAEAPVADIDKQEIENRLESEFEAVSETSPSEALKVDPAEVEKTPVQAEIEEEVESMLQHNSSRSEAEVVDMPKSENVVHDVETKMDFAVEGQMNLKLNFWVNGQQITLWVNQKEGFTIEMGGGAKFVLPIGDKKAA